MDTFIYNEGEKLMGLMQGFFKPKNPKKYKGKVNNIVYRSSWELKYMIELDSDPTVLEWSSEEIIVPYTSPIDRSFRRYFPDFYVMKKRGTVVECYLIEIKPSAQTRKPKPQGNRKGKKLLAEEVTFVMNQAKWEAAQRYCEKRGWKFQVLTEKELKTF